MKRILLLTFLVLLIRANAQDRPIKVVTEEIPKRLEFYAINENEQDFDVKITIEGTNFRQSRAKPRFVRVPATSKVHLKTIFLMRDKKPIYTYNLEVNDSLSDRALKTEFELIKIEPKKRIVVYIPVNCTSCDSLISPLTQGIYLFTSHQLAERPKIKEQLAPLLGRSVVLDSTTTPIVNLGGRLYTQIETYEELLEELSKD
jgi:hypothetical protein